MAFPTNYSQYDTVTIDSLKIGTGGVTNFDIWLPVSLLSATAQSTLRSDGGDARFTLNDGTTRIAHDAILNSSSVLIGFRVNIPSLSDVTDTVIRCWYNGVDVAEAPGSTYGQYATYSGVSLYSPLEYDPTGTAPQMLDRTSNANHGTALNSGVTSVAGQVGNGGSFNGSGGYVSSPNSASLNKGVAAFSISCWLKSTVVDRAVIAKIGGTSPYPGYNIYLLSTGHIRLRAGSNLTSSGTPVDGTTNVADGNWHFIAAMRTATQLLLYVDGVLDGSVSLAASNCDNTNIFTIGNNSLNGAYFNGQIDEARLEVERSAAWIKTAYNNEKSPATFFSNVTAGPSGGGTPSTTRQFPGIGSAMIQGACG